MNDEKEQRMKVVKQQRYAQLNAAEQKLNKTVRIHGKLYLVGAIAFTLALVAVGLGIAASSGFVSVLAGILLGVSKLAGFITGIAIPITRYTWLHQWFQKSNLDNAVDITEIEEQFEKVSGKKEQRFRILKQVKKDKLDKLNEESRKEIISFALNLLGAFAFGAASSLLPIFVPVVCYFMAKCWKKFVSWVDKKHHEKSLETYVNSKEAELIADGMPLMSNEKEEVNDIAPILNEPLNETELKGLPPEKDDNQILKIVDVKSPDEDEKGSSRTK